MAVRRLADAAIQPKSFAFTVENLSLKALDPERPIREADIARRGWHGRKVPIAS
jgi:hypothetical protein